MLLAKPGAQILTKHYLLVQTSCPPTPHTLLTPHAQPPTAMRPTLHWLAHVPLLDRPREAVDHTIADQVSSYWANFDKTGNPNAEGLPPWPAFRENPNQTMAPGADMGPIPLASPEKIAFRQSTLNPSS